LSEDFALGLDKANKPRRSPSIHFFRRGEIMDIDVVQDYYGKTLRSSDDLKTMACCTPGDMPARVEALLANLHDEVLAKYYGCGLVCAFSTSAAASAATSMRCRSSSAPMGKSSASI
jgi:hypothetical protein